MSTIDAALLGGAVVLYNGNAVNLPYKKAYALLYYIIIKRKVSRSELTALLWPDVETPTALKNLRHANFYHSKEPWGGSVPARSKGRPCP